MIRPAVTIEEKSALITYLTGKLGTSSQMLIGAMPFQGAVVLRRGVPMGAVLYTNFRHYSVEMIAAGEPGWIARDDIRAVFRYPFEVLGVHNVLTMVGRQNAASRELHRRLGFCEMCVIHTSPVKSDDIILYSMTRDKCHWLHAPQPLQEAA